ncbi:MAG TPA: TonB-dependent receptor [Caulobacteraceae bacterium]
MRGMGAGAGRRGRWAAALLATTAMAGVTPAFAQSAEANTATTVDELIVTAQKREENLQRVPLSIQAIGTQRLEELQVADFDDFARFLPSVSFRSSGPGFVNIYMRGVASGENGNHSGPLPSVGVYLDEQPVTTITGPLDIHIYDVARVEALAGPQGTLYGASSEAGTIRIITNKPDLSGFSASYDLEVNSVAHGGIGYVAEGYANIPINEKMAVRLVGWYDHDAGYIDNIFGTQTYMSGGTVDDPTANATTIDNAGLAQDDFNEVDTFGARAALRFDVNENWTITPTIMGQSQESDGTFWYAPHVGELEVMRFRPDYAKDKWWQAALTIQGKIGNFDLTYAGAYLKRDVDGASDYSDYTYFYDNLYGYGAYWYDNNGDLGDFSQYIEFKDHYRKESHELRLASPADWRLRFVTGVFYQRQQHGIEQRYKIDNLVDFFEVPGWPDTIWLTKQTRVDRDYAVFGEATFDITPALKATGGVRLYKADNSLVGFFGYGFGGYSSNPDYKCFAPAIVEGSPCTNLDKRVEETGATYKANLTWQIDQDRMVYATYSTGFRPPGINRRGSLPPYQSDFLENYEVGWKTSWLDGRLRWNGALFFEKWEDFQFSFLGENGLTVIANAGSAEMKGIETDFSVRPTEGLLIYGSATWVDAKLTQNYCGQLDANGEPVTDCALPLAPEGTQLPITPKFKGNITARYEWPMGSFNAFTQGSFVYQGSAWADLRSIDYNPITGDPQPIREAIGKQKSYGSLDLSAGLGRDNWTVEAFAKNVTDELGDVTRSVQCNVQVCTGGGALPGRVYIVPIQPRTIGIRFGQKF